MLDGNIRSLGHHEPPGPALEHFAALLSTECFRFALESPRMPAPDTALSLKQWWEDGGHDWLASYLELPELGPTTDLQKHVVVPPDTRRTLRVGAGPDHLEPLLCALDDAACGADTRGWNTRAQAFLALHHTREKASQHDEDRKNTPDSHALRCMESAAKAPDALRYTGWRGCLEWQRPKRWTLPLGHLKAPASGWLIVSGRRGHYSFCDAIGAYQLATGAAYIAESCSELVLGKGGDVDRRATRDRARSRMLTGTLRLDNVREAAWGLLLLGEAQEVQVEAEFYPLQGGLTPVLVAEAWHGPISLSGRGWMTTAQTYLDWSWVPQEAQLATGTLRWPNSPNGVEEHAAGLLEVAEGTLVEGCPPSPPPPIHLMDRKIRVDGRDAIPGIDKQLVERFRGWRPVPPCDPSRTRTETSR